MGQAAETHGDHPASGMQRLAFGAGDGCKRAGKAVEKEDNETDGKGVYRKLPSGLMVADGSGDAWESNQTRMQGKATRIR